MESKWFSKAIEGKMIDKILRMLVQDKGSEIIAEVERMLVERYKDNAMVSEADFILGATTVIRFLGLEEDAKTLPAELVPPSWIFNIMGNRSIVADVMLKNGVVNEAQAQSINSRKWKEIYRRAFLDDAVSALHTVMRTADKYTEMGLTKAQALEWLKEEAEVILENMLELEEEE